MVDDPVAPERLSSEEKAEDHCTRETEYNEQSEE